MGKVVGVRGAVSVEENKRDDILLSTGLLLREMVVRNNIDVENIASVIFTSTNDLNAAFPAEAARKMGWNETALMDAVEISVPGSMPMVVRVLMHVNVGEDGFKPENVYMGNTQKLRPDL